MNKKIVEYTVVGSTDLKLFEHVVNEAIKDGRQPHGVMVGYFSMGEQFYYHQAMVKYE